LTGIIVLDSTGAILVGTCESYPNNWNFERTGSTTAAGKLINLAHSGGGAFQLETLDSWPAGAHARLYRTVDVKTGANRIARLFRGPGILAGIYDDFPGTSLDTTNKWTKNAGSPSVSGGILTVPSTADIQTKDAIIPLYQTILAKIKPALGFVWHPYFYNLANEFIGVYFGGGAYGTHLHLYSSSGYGHDDVDCGEFSTTEYAEYKIIWSSNAVTLYRNGSQVGQVTTAVHITTQGPGRTHFYGQSGQGFMDWQGWLGDTDKRKVSFNIGSQTLMDQDIETETRALSNGFFDSDWIAVNPTGNQTVEMKFRNASGSPEGKSAQCTVDDLIIMLDSQITVHGMLGGQKIELCDSGGSVRATATCPETGQDVYLTGLDDLITTAYGFSGYFKVYDTDGQTLIYTSPTDARWGGDIYTWIPNETAMDISADHTLVYRTGSGLSPTQATVTIKLKDKESGSPLNDKTIYWTPNLGTCDPESNNTDVNGEASTIFTAGVNPGFGGVLAEFLGDATYGPSSIIQAIDIYYTQPTPDPDKDFQAWIAGQEAVVAAGSYKLSSDFKPQSFSITTPMMSLSVGGWWAIEVYRKGVVEFIGRIFTRDRQSGMNPQTTVTGVDEIIMVQRRVANKGYTDEPKLIIQDLLTRYPCGISAGNIATYGAVIKIDATYQNLYDALMQVAKITGWNFRLNPNRTLDFAPAFGVTRDITIQSGGSLAQGRHHEDWSQIDTKVYVIGKAAEAALVSVAEDPQGSLTYGLIEEPFFEKNIDEQGTLDLRAQEILAQHQGVKETIGPIDWTDTLATGSYAPHDSVSVIDPETGLNGLYVVKSLSRDLTDANKAALELSNRLDTLADAMQSIRKTVRDLAVT
jgi:hypothetical protein